MELRQQLSTLRPYRTFLMSFVLLVTLATAVFSLVAEPRYVTSLSMTVNRINRQETSDYQFDGYYAIQASDLFSQTVLSWFLTPSVLLEFYTEADLAPRLTTTNELVGRFRARKFSAQNIVVQFTEHNRETAEKLALTIGKVVKERGEALNQTAEHEGLFEIVPGVPVVVETLPNVAVNTALAFFASLIVGFALATSVRYLRD